MTRINKEAQKAKKESQRAIQYPRKSEPVPEPILKSKPVKKAKKKVVKKKAKKKK